MPKLTMELRSISLNLRNLTQREYDRIQGAVRMSVRDRMIRAAFREEQESGVTYSEAIENVARGVWDGQVLSERQVRRIIYGF